MVTWMSERDRVGLSGDTHVPGTGSPTVGERYGWVRLLGEGSAGIGSRWRDRQMKKDRFFFCTPESDQLGIFLRESAIHGYYPRFRLVMDLTTASPFS